MKTKFVLQLKHGVSRAQSTYGYNIVSLYVDGKKIAAANGGGYDMAGTVLGSWITATFQKEIRKLPANYGSEDDNKGLYGLVHQDPVTSQRKNVAGKGDQTFCDGGCGWDSMERILEAIGWNLKRTDDGWVATKGRKKLA